ncbi:MAG: type II secretion system minor pseudopilin GspK [Gammaproteobacteria bacterium]|nr:type II secretion system minor pseudopilin GspK [Gammaproteobacteria bacterium]
MLYPLKHKQQGSAIIIALFVMSLVAVIAVTMLSRLHTDVQRTHLILNADNENLIAQGSIAWAVDTLITNWKKHQPNQLVDHMPIYSKKDVIQGVEIESALYDAQGFFNVNNLSAEENQLGFVQLLKAVDPKIDIVLANNIAIATHDWVSPSEKKNQELDKYYLENKPSYSAPHHLMASVSELRLVKGMSASLFFKLSPYIVALPINTKLNITSASEITLMSLSSTLTLDAAKTIIHHRNELPFTSVANFTEYEIVKNNSITDKNNLTTLSNYFLLQTHISVGQQKLMLYTLLLRNTNNEKPNVIVLWQTKGTL